MNHERASISSGTTPKERVAAILAALPGAILRERTYNWESAIEFRILGAGVFTLEVSPAGCVVEPRPARRPNAVFVFDVDAFLRIYDGPPIERILQAIKSGAVRTNDFEQLVFFARAFDHAALGRAFAQDISTAAPSAPSLGERVRCEASFAASLARGARHGITTRVETLADRVTYELDRAWIERRDLAGFEWIVSAASGLYAVSRTSAARIARGVFNGVTVRDGAIYAYQACDWFLKPTHRGRILRIEVANERVEGVSVFARGLDNNIHQIDFVGDRLLAADTHNDRVLELDLAGRVTHVRYPLGDAMSKDPLRAVRAAHINCLFARGDRVYLMCHNSSDWTGKPSEILECDSTLRVLRRIPIRGRASHNIAVLGEGDIRYCSSEAGEVHGPGGAWLTVHNGAFVRGLSIGERTVAVGASDVTYRADRARSAGRIYFFEPSGARIGHLTLPGAPREIRRIDGRDFGLSNYRPGHTGAQHHPMESEVHA